MHVTRQRVTKVSTGLLSRSTGRRVQLLAAATAALVVAGGGIAYANTGVFGFDQVGQTTDKGLVVSGDQYIKPIGDRLVINNGKIMSSSVSPDGTHIAAAVTDGGAALAIVDLKTWKVQQVVSNAASSTPRISGNDVGQEGPTYSPDGKHLWLGRTDGYTRFDVNADGSVANPVDIKIPADGSKHSLAAAAVFSADGSTVYSAVNGQNRVVALDAATGAITQSWAVGNAPRGMVQVGNKLYVSNEGGRPAKPGETTINSYGTQVPADPNTGATTTGTVSVIDLANPTAAPASIDVGLHPTALYAKNGALFVTNTATNDVSVIDTASNRVVQTIATRPWPEATVGYEPDAVTLTDDGHLLVTLGGANAVAVYRYTSPLEPVSYVGLLPTDYFPAEITTVGNDVVVSNTRGIDARRSTGTAHGTHDTTSSLTRFTLPSDDVIKDQTGKVFTQNGWHGGSPPASPGNGKAPEKPVPVKLGDPSAIKHVFLLVKENRTYDQVYGDMPQGNGAPALAQYGANVTPNQHALAQQFGLYDNTYDIGTNSAEGHNWVMQADNPEYTESSAGEYLRSYDTEDDALGHQTSGFIWTGAQAAGKSVRDFGEFQQFLTKPAGATWQNLYCDTKNMEATGQDTAYPLVSSSPIPSLNDVSVHGFPKFDTSVPDMYRYEIWKRDFEKNGPANLNMLWLSSDHTGGPPNGAAQVADNDLATGKIVDEISHSPYWKDSAIFILEDDSQAGTDHVDGHRAPIQIISPYAQHGAVDSHYYTQITMIRTIEQILGIKPMNQKDSAATPMDKAFTPKPDLTPFTAVPNRTSLTEGIKTLPACGADVPAPQNHTATPAPPTPNGTPAPPNPTDTPAPQNPTATPAPQNPTATPAPQNPTATAAPQNPTATAAPPNPTATVVPADKQSVAAQWDAWKSQQNLTGPDAKPDSSNPAQMNHFAWYEAHGWTQPYPGEDKIYAPNDVPGAFIPSSDSDG